MAIHCPECGFVNAEGANYCQKCGAYLSRPEGKDEPTTMTYTVDESGEMHQVDIDEVVERHGAALVIRSGGGRAGESFTLDDERVSIGRTPDAGVFLDDVTVSRNHALLVRRKDGLYIDDLGSLNGTYVNRRRIESHQLRGRRRDSDRQVQAELPGEVMEASTPTPFDQRTPDGATDSAPSNRKALTIGAVAKILGREFEDISISKIRYLEDQKLLAPRRTPGGYRLYSQADVERLRTILRMQRDEFLPLRVIRQELAAGAREERGEMRLSAQGGQRRGRQGQSDDPPGTGRRHRRGGRPDQGPRGLAPRAARKGRRRQGLRRHRPRDRQGVLRTGEIRGRRPQPEGAAQQPPIARPPCSRPWWAPGFDPRTTTPARRRSRTWRASPRPAATSPTCCSSAICGS